MSFWQNRYTFLTESIEKGNNSNAFPELLEKAVEQGGFSCIWISNYSYLEPIPDTFRSVRPADFDFLSPGAPNFVKNAEKAKTDFLIPTGGIYFQGWVCIRMASLEQHAWPRT